jgi:hypothetical protein
METAMMGRETQNVAFYYPGHLWYDVDQIKNMLLFFDGVGILIPEYKKGEPEHHDPVLAGSLRERGLLHYLVADEVVDKGATDQLVDAMERVISSGALEPLMTEQTAFHELSMSRLGYYGNRELAERLFQQLKARGLARESEDGASIPMHPLVRYLVLILLAQLVRPAGSKMGLDLAPITDRLKIVEALQEILDLPGAGSSGHVVAFDLQTVTVNLASVPLDEVLDFRAQHRDQHRRYIRSLRRFAREISLLPAEDQRAAFADRQAELDDYASDMKRAARTAWRKQGTVAVGLAGAAWTMTGDPIAGQFTACGALIPNPKEVQTEHGAFSYLLSAQERYR